ncbi:MAG: hypothetical protein M1834_009335 [Cirrosporium novae-zelandiae]|nr:MAG: hypothetical protein M1834_009335 [Cirrosporium novae-zelandiae]
MSYNTYLMRSAGMPRDHLSIFVETHEDGFETGYIYQVTGNIQTGMTHGHRKSDQNPERSETFLSKELIGKVPIEKYLHVKEICDSIAPPKKQFERNTRLYPSEPLRRCQEWTKEAIQKLKTAEVIQQ